MLKYKVKKGDSLWKIVSNYGLYPKHQAIDNIIIANKLWRYDYLEVDQELIIPLIGLYYQVKSGDTLWSIGKMFDITLNHLLYYNKINNPYLIYPGTKIYFEKKIFEPANYMVCIDPGHQKIVNYEKDQNDYGSRVMNTKVSSVAQGTYTGKPEYEITLEIGLKLRNILEIMGYSIVMTRESNDANLSNIERAIIANESGSDICIRIHADVSENNNAQGISVLYPAKDSPNSTVSKYQKCKLLTEYILEGMIEATDATDRGVVARKDIIGFNFSTIPVVLPEVGFMSNKEEDIKLSTNLYQYKLAEGMAEGISKFFFSKL